MDNLASLLTQAEHARIELEKVLSLPRGAEWVASSDNPAKLKACDVIITPNEVTPRHGTGVLIKRLFGASSGVFSIRSRNLYNEHHFGERSLWLDQTNLSRPQIYIRLLKALEGYHVRRIVCVPFYPDDLLTAIALKEIFNAPLCTYLMDDQNIWTKGINDDLMQEALNKSTLRLAISPEMRDAYENRYRHKFWLLPPLVDADLVNKAAPLPHGKNVKSHTGLLVGNLWSTQWLEWLRKTVRGSGLEIHWYGNASASWLNVTPEELKEDGITDCGFVPEAELNDLCRQYPYALVPTGTLEETDHTGAIARLSLPTRMPFLLATAHIPMLVMGNRNTCAARFVERFQCGLICNYQPESFREAVEKITSDSSQRQMRANAAAKAPGFSSAQATEWLWSALAAGQPTDMRFEQLMPRTGADMVVYVEGPTPPDVWMDFAPTYHVMQRLRRHNNYQPDFVIDVGASSGVWSHAARAAFPDARFILIDPLLETYAGASLDFYRKTHPKFEWIEAAVSDASGQVQFQISEDLYGSSLLHPDDHRRYITRPVPAITLDDLARDRKLTGRGLLKIDVQCAEHKVLAGATKPMPRIDGIVLEVSMIRLAPGALVFDEILALMQKIGFRYYDELGHWRSPVDGALQQKDIFFFRDEILQAASSPSNGN